MKICVYITPHPLKDRWGQAGQTLWWQLLLIRAVVGFRMKSIEQGAHMWSLAAGRQGGEAQLGRRS